MNAIALLTCLSSLTYIFLTDAVLATVRIGTSEQRSSRLRIDDFLDTTPIVKIDGKWMTPSGCNFQNEIVCPVPGEGTLFVRNSSPHDFKLSFVASRPLVVEGFGLQGQVVGFAPDRPLFILSNGFQSWSNSGWLKLPVWPSESSLSHALRHADDPRDGTKVSWEYAALSNRLQHVWIGATAANTFKPWVQFGRTANGNISFMAAAGDTGERVSLSAGEALDGDGWYVDFGTELEPMQRTYAARLRHFFLGDDPRALPRVGWNSWYNQWNKVNETAVLAHIPLTINLFDELFRKQGVTPPTKTLLVDDGWESMWGEWWANDKFPSGLTALANKIKAGGAEPGLWIAPFLVDVKSSLVSEKPDWFVKDALYHHPSGTYKVLDVTHPEVAEHLDRTIRTLVGYGFGKIKIDFLMTGSMEGERYEQVTGLQAFHRGMKIIREAAGKETYLLACGAPALASLPYVNAWRIGADIAMGFPTTFIGPSWVDVTTQARNIGARWFLCGLVHCDADPLLRRRPHSASSALTAGWVAALAGGGLYLSDDLRSLPENRKAWPLPAPLLHLALGGQAAVPDPQIPSQVPSRLPDATALKRLLFKNDIYPASSWRLPDGQRIFINFTGRGTMHEGVAVPRYSTVFENES